ncbi:DUF503 domain-containing protein [Oceanirhabdus sp. W0125-5]|uniref:DUF503 domain-containing protein n=1 Tax=Oceanirhabdus sp. W0125-5 TaxID=2999116 RepID=UPI0022F2D15B|nr:DUF503 domain-containing protein [Oceanirhabdus sp. W0125-5]WBW97895.1 DUF503 domain-containing protein [Oceanirhabdus sp. W0125-5]
MFVGLMRVELRASWVNSLKEKRMIIKSLMSRIKNRFNVSICEVDKHDIHKNIVIGMAIISTTNKDLDGIMEGIVRYIENTEEAVIIDVEKEML